MQVSVWPRHRWGAEFAKRSSTDSSHAGPIDVRSGTAPIGATTPAYYNSPARICRRGLTAPVSLISVSKAPTRLRGSSARDRYTSSDHALHATPADALVHMGSSCSSGNAQLRVSIGGRRRMGSPAIRAAILANVSFSAMMAMMSLPLRLNSSIVYASLWCL